MTDDMIEAIAALFKQHHRDTCYPIAMDFEVEAFAKAAHAAAQPRHETEIAKAVAAERERGQREGKAAVCSWLRGLGAQKPSHLLRAEARLLAEAFERPEIPAQAIRGDAI